MRPHSTTVFGELKGIVPPY